MRTLLLALLFSVVLLISTVSHAFAQTAKMGMHVLSMGEVEPAVTLLREQDKNNDQWYYITIPFTNEDVAKSADWQVFFAQAKTLRVIPIVRLATQTSGDSWIIPNRKTVVDQLNLLAALEWPTAERRVIIFNEVNHAKEWGNEIDPAAYAELFRFSALWARSLQKNFIVMPAAMDLAAPNGTQTRDAFNYLNGMAEFDSDIFTYADAWNSHSYPNPAFSAPPQRKGQNSLYGYQHELAYLEKKGITTLPVYITETGWVENRTTSRYLASYYLYAFKNIWLPDSRIVAVTPFVFAGSPGPFATFSFTTANGKPTVHYDALKKVLGTTSTISE
jgi:hypothetical protein